MTGMLAGVAVWALVLYQADAPPAYVEPYRIYATPFACDARRLFFVSLVNVPGEFKCERIEVLK